MPKTQGYKVRTKLAKLFPDYAMDVDNEGGIIIYTGMIETDDDRYIPQPEEIMS
jgi:hypothetical protein